MTPRPTRRQPVEQYVADSWKLAELCIALADAWPELLRLDEMHAVPDGYGTGNTDRGGPGTVADPSAATVFKLAGGKLAEETDDGRPTADTWDIRAEHIGTLTENLLAQFGAMTDTARRIAGIKRLVEGRADGRVGRQSSLTDCLACEKPVSGVGNDRIRAGYCLACYRAWQRWVRAEMEAGREPVHVVFRMRRQAELAKAQVDEEKARAAGKAKAS